MRVMSVEVDDPIYGRSVVEEPLLVDLLASPSVLRLKEVGQFGIPDEYHHRANFTRYHHSVGVMLLLKSQGASVLEQAAGLTHDVSHEAFSHVAGWAQTDYRNSPNKNEDQQDQAHQSFILHSEIPSILDRYKLLPEILNYQDQRYQLLERHIPDLCADRIDYCLRELSPTLARELFNSLRVVDDQFVFDSFLAARKFGVEFLNLQRSHWGGFEGIARYFWFSQILKEALRSQCIIAADFLKTDDYVLAKIEDCQNPKILEALNILKSPVLLRPKEGIVVHKKFRYVDPLFITSTGLERVSQVDEGYKRALELARTENAKGVLVPNLPF